MRISKKVYLIIVLLNLGNIVYSNPGPAVICNHHQDCGNGGGGYYTPAPVVYTVQSYFGAAFGGFDVNHAPIVGWATQQKSKRKARKLALSECIKKGGQNCQELAWVRNNCIGVIVREEFNHAYSINTYGGTKSEILKNAKAACEPGDFACYVEDIKCSTHPNFMYKLE